MTPEGIRKVKVSRMIREKTGEETETLGIAGETLLTDLQGAREGDLLRGPVRNHRR